jgi:dihydrofolate reductase
MGRIVVSEFISLDGVIEAPGGEPGYRHTNWVTRFPDQAVLNYKVAEALDHEALLLGRKTYESFADAWPERDDVPGELGVVAKKFNSMPKYVASTTLVNPAWNNTTVLNGDAMAAVARLKAEVQGDILVHGSGRLAHSLKQHDLVDEYRLMVFPIILGSGMRLFDETLDATTLKLVDSQRFESGTMVLAYEPVRDSATSA